MQKPKHRAYPSYFDRYIKLVPEGDIIAVLENQLDDMVSLMNSFSEEVSIYRYAPDKWCIKEVLGHLIDTERVFSYRALCFARNDRTHLPGFDQDDYVAESDFSTRTLFDINEEYQTVRRATISLFCSLNDKIWERSGTASDYTLSLRAIPYIIAGHELHHRAVIEERYLNIAP